MRAVQGVRVQSQAHPVRTVPIFESRVISEMVTLLLSFFPHAWETFKAQRVVQWWLTITTIAFPYGRSYQQPRPLFISWSSSPYLIRNDPSKFRTRNPLYANVPVQMLAHLIISSLWVKSTRTKQKIYQGRLMTSKVSIWQQREKVVCLKSSRLSDAHGVLFHLETMIIILNKFM